MLANNDSSNKKKDTKRVHFFTLFYVSLFGFVLLSGSSMLSIPSSIQTPMSQGVPDAYAQEYYQQQQYGYDDKSYGGGNDNYYYSNTYDNKRQDKSYDKKNDYNYASSYDDNKKKKNFAEIEKFDNKLFVCENGIVVDDRINCPQQCPFNTALEGVYVKDLDVCNIQPGVGLTCPLDTDLPGVVVVNEADCNIFEICDASSTPLGLALGQDVKVADSALCQLTNIPDLQICEDGPFEGFAVIDQEVCDTLDSVQICSLTSDLPGVLTTDTDTCNIFEQCDLNTPLGASIGQTVDVVDADICQLQFHICGSTDPLAVALGLEGPIVVADEQLCELAVTTGTTTCPAGSDLEGVVVLKEFEDLICSLKIPQVVTCPSFSPLGKALGNTAVEVTDAKLCELEVTSGTTTCDAGTTLAGVVVDEDQASVVCDLPVCPPDTDLAGHVLAPGIEPTDEVCNIECEVCDASISAKQSTSSDSPIKANTMKSNQVQKTSTHNTEQQQTMTHNQVQKTSNHNTEQQQTMTHNQVQKTSNHNTEQQQTMTQLPLFNFNK